MYDDPQTIRAKGIFDLHGSEGGALFVSDIVLVELCWTHDRSYRLTVPPSPILLQVFRDPRHFPSLKQRRLQRNSVALIGLAVFWEDELRSVH